VGYHELLADDVSSEVANQNVNQVSIPYDVILDDGTKISRPTTQESNLRINNTVIKRPQTCFTMNGL